MAIRSGLAASGALAMTNSHTVSAISTMPTSEAEEPVRLPGAPLADLHDGAVTAHRPTGQGLGLALDDGHGNSLLLCGANHRAPGAGRLPSDSKVISQ